ncbi:hypothetical protein QR98_0014130 [Sarcoptes scabiei]|uniref:Uncharacterized protein n=2 Tax=Sarcoptes scabiei TaxID=52283 RepID=A0A131ZW18_SARSC|nr:hypothetical protein QR98_0014130 [Sarcoptes scabiei]
MKSHQYSQHRHNAKHHALEIEPGDKVYVPNGNKLNRRKLDAPFEGPYLVQDKMGENVVRVNKKGRLIPFHCSQLKLTTILMIYLIILAIAEEVSIMKHEPIIWKTTDFKVADRVSYNILKIVQVSPCEILKYQNVTEPYLSKCYETSLENNRKLAKYCTGKQRKERGLGVLGVTTVVIAAETIMGLVGKTLFRNSYEESMLKLEEELTKFKNRTNEVESKITELVNKTVADIVNLEKLVSDEIKQSLPTDRIIAEMITTQRIAEKFFLEAKRGKVNQDFPYLFPNLPMTNQSDQVELWEFVECRTINFTAETMEFEMDIIIPTIDPELVVLKAFPFVIYQRAQKDYCKHRYAGPEYVCLDTKANCVKKIENNFHQMLITRDKVDDDCYIPGEGTIFSLESCGKPESKIQVQYNKDALYLYCYDHLIGLPALNITCGNHVYVIPKNTLVSINGTKMPLLYDEKVTERHQFYDRSKIMSINKQLMGNSTEYEFELKELSKLLRYKEDESSAGFRWESPSWTGSTAFILLFVYSILKYWIKRKPKPTVKTTTLVELNSLLTSLGHTTDRAGPGAI